MPQLILGENRIAGGVEYSLPCVRLHTEDSKILNAFGKDANGREEVEGAYRDWYASMHPLEKTYELIDFGGTDEARFEGVSRGQDGGEHPHVGDLLCVLKRMTNGPLCIHVTSVHDRS